MRRHPAAGPRFCLGRRGGQLGDFAGRCASRNWPTVSSSPRVRLPTTTATFSSPISPTTVSSSGAGHDGILPLSCSLRPSQWPLFRCQGKPLGLTRRTSYGASTPKGKAAVVLKDYQGKMLNGPERPLGPPEGGNLSDRSLLQAGLLEARFKEQDKEAVYYLAPDHKTLTRVADDL